MSIFGHQMTATFVIQFPSRVLKLCITKHVVLWEASARDFRSDEEHPALDAKNAEDMGQFRYGQARQGYGT